MPGHLPKRLLRPPALLLAAAAAGVLMLAACAEDGVDDGRVRAVTTLPLIAEMVQSVGGERVDVTALLSAGSDPHTFEPAPRDVRRISEARIAFVNGLGLEPGVLRVIEANLPSGAALVRLGEEARAAADGRGLEMGEEDDPHLWLDPRAATLYAEIITERLAGVDPEGAEEFAANLERYAEEIAGLDAYISERIGQIAPEDRKLVTAHDAFSHLAQYAGLGVVAFVAEAPGREPSPAEVARLGRAIRDEAVPAVFVEPQASTESDVLRRAAADAGVPVCTLYSDALDADVDSYIALMRFNADELARCLGGGDGG